MAHVSHKLSNSFAGALAGGGDPATSPLYVFGPFLKLIVVAGVAQVTFGASIWLAVLTIVMVSAMYRLVMRWVVDGSGGSGLSEDEFGSWAVKTNASITFMEYTLTFLVSMAALVTFIADRFPFLNDHFLGIQYRAFVAIILSVLTGWLVNRGPKMAARAFGPATAAVLLLLWIMVLATIRQHGLHLPAINLEAFRPAYIGFTFGGYARILAVMTGIEIFANLVAAYDGTPAEKSRKAFGSLLIIMGTTAATMLVVGPAIFELSTPTNPDVSVFTQTMDQLLPAPLPWLGTLIGVGVLLSASAASAQGLQNLAVGLKFRNYVPVFIGRQNRFDVATMPVWIEISLVTLCFLFFGTNEETYLAIYAAGVFVLLSMTGWAVVKRLLREMRTAVSLEKGMSLVGTAVAALLTTGATFIIFGERFREGAWTYFIFIPALYGIFTYFRRHLGEPTPMKDRFGMFKGEQRFLSVTTLHDHFMPLQRILVPLDGSGPAEEALFAAQSIGTTLGVEIMLLTVSANGTQPGRMVPVSKHPSARQQPGDADQYLQQISAQLMTGGAQVCTQVSHGQVAAAISEAAADMDLVVMSTNGRFGFKRLLGGSVTGKVIQTGKKPVLLLRLTNDGHSKGTCFKRLLVALDGSEYSEKVLPYVRLLARYFGSDVLLLTVPVGFDAESAQNQIHTYLQRVADEIREDGIEVTTLVTGSGPARTIVRVSEEERVDLIMLVTHGRGGFDRLMVGSVADRVTQHMPCPVFLVPI